jgi:hypothetical protein
MCLKRLATCDLVSDSDELRMFREMRASMVAMALLIQFRTRTGFSLSTYVLLVRTNESIQGILPERALYVRFVVGF